MKTKKHKIIILSIMVLTILFIISCCDSVEPNPPTPPTEPDTTSHKITWEIDTLGDWQSRLRNIWGTSPENLWAIGWIIDGSWGTNIIHYDGEKWEEYDYYEADLAGIYGFNENNIWAVGSNLILTQFYALIAHYDGSTWKTVYIDKTSKTLMGVWGSSPNDIFAVGFEGTILHYDGVSWTKMESNTTANLVDVWGFAPNDVYACSEMDVPEKTTLLHYDGTEWESILDSMVTEPGSISSVWGTSSENVYFTSSFGFYQGSKGNGWSYSYIPDDHTAQNALRGNSNYNIFICGDYGLVLHYNGKTWYRYDEIFSKKYPYGPILNGIMVFEDKVFIVGEDFQNARAIIYKGTIEN
ncbi:MAG: hypothetical protein JXA68_06995 [Ignavibacteriales bacterium]|nr:hypothetical protein [Ignavibacteriales bacterium]